MERGHEGRATWRCVEGVGCDGVGGAAGVRGTSLAGAAGSANGGDAGGRIALSPAVKLPVGTSVGDGDTSQRRVMVLKQG